LRYPRDWLLLLETEVDVDGRIGSARVLDHGRSALALLDSHSIAPDAPLPDSGEINQRESADSFPGDENHFAATALKRVCSPPKVTAKVKSKVKAKKASGSAEALWEQWWAKPDDTQLLRIYADALEAAGDPRGPLIQLGLVGSANRTADQEAMMEMQTEKGACAPAGKTWLREYEFGEDDGLVVKGRTDLPKLLEGVAELGRIHPRFILTLTSTSVKTLRDAVALGGVSPAALGRIWMIDFGVITAEIRGSLGGCQLSDKQLAAIAPAFADVTHVQLSCRGNPNRCFTPAGLRAFGAHAKALRYLSVDFHPTTSMPSIGEYGRAIRESFGRVLCGVDFTGMTAGDLAMPRVKLNAIGDLNYYHRNDLAAQLVAAGLG
jgi:hypothetical protein